MSEVCEIPARPLPGSFVLREADDDFADLRRYVQETGTAKATVSGGGLLRL